MKRVFAVGLIILLLVGSALSVEQPKQVVIERHDVPGFIGYVEDEIVVKFDEAVVASMDLDGAAKGQIGIYAIDRLGEQLGVISVAAQFPNAQKKSYRGQTVDLSGWHLIKFSGPVNAVSAAEEYKKLAGVIDAQPIGIHTVYATPNDGYYANQWHLNRANDHDMDAPEAWDIETGDPAIIVAILDSGVRYFHKDLGGYNASYSNPTAADGNMWINWAEKNGTTGVDDDGNGKVDDWVGWDFVTGATPCWSGEDCNTVDNDPRDFNGHGTHCAGNVAAINNNGYATCGPAGGWGNGTLQPTANGVKIMACRIGWSGSYLGYEVGYVRMDFAAQAFYYAADNGAKIASCSWGSSNSGGIADAISYFLAEGGLIFHAAGNDGSQTADYMGGRTDIVNVAATDSNDCKADFSTYGTWVDISAPGTGILSSYHDHTDAQNDYIAALDGTSMATPLTAAVAALIWSKNPSWTATEVKTQLFDSADDIYGLSCNSSYSGKLGAGRVNAFNAVNTGGPGAPVANFSGSPTSGCAPLTVAFSDLSTGEITSWSWTFGDGGTSYAQNPSHQYTSANSYTVSLTVNGPGGTDTETKTNYIVVSGVPVANFVGTPTSGDAPLTVNFTDQSTGTPTAWSWTFGDGGTSNDKNPSHQYVNPGVYTVSLTASNACGSDGETKTDYITVNEPPAQQCDDFADGNISNWVNKRGTWTATGGYMKGNSTTTDARTTSPFGSFTSANLSCDVRMNTGQTQRKARLVFAYVDGSNYRYIEGDDINNRWYICERVSNRNYTRLTISRTITTAQWYHVEINIAADGNVTLNVDGVPIGSYKFSSAKAGLVGCGYNRANCDFDNFCVGATRAAAMEFAENPAEAYRKSIPQQFELFQNYPNPFNPTTIIGYNLPEAGFVNLKVINILGQEIRILVNEWQDPGPHSVVFDASELASGVYFYRLQSGQYVESRRMLLLK